MIDPPTSPRAPSTPPSGHTCSYAISCKGNAKIRQQFSAKSATLSKILQNFHDCLPSASLKQAHHVSILSYPFLSDGFTEMCIKETNENEGSQLFQLIAIAMRAIQWLQVRAPIFAEIRQLVTFPIPDDEPVIRIILPRTF